MGMKSGMMKPREKAPKVKEMAEMKRAKANRNM